MRPSRILTSMKDYANGEERTKLTYLASMSKLVQDLIGGNLLSKEEKTELKHILTRNEKALKMILRRLKPEVSEKIAREINDYEPAMVPRIRYKINPRTMQIDDDRLRDILEIEINDHCIGCKEPNFLHCIIYNLNDDLEVCSRHTEPAGTCPYAYLAQEEKKQRPNYGSIIKEKKGGQNDKQ